LGGFLAFLFNNRWQLQSPFTDLDSQLLIALLLLFEALAVLCAVALAASTRLGEVSTLTVCVLVFLLGLTSEYYLGRFIAESWAARIAYILVPNLQYHWLADALTQGHSVSWRYVAFATGYSLSYGAAILGVAVALFQTREVG
ncbi:MAG: hypothetical protein V3T77_07650, partial [Planctomycetota bacterium]